MLSFSEYWWNSSNVYIWMHFTEFTVNSVDMDVESEPFAYFSVIIF